jgi:hypothetical protein
MGRGEVPERRRDIRSQENRDLVILEIPRRDHSRESRVDTCQEIPQSREIGESEFSNTKRSRHTESRSAISRQIWTVHLVDTWQRSAPSGKVPTRSKSIGV